MNDYYFTFRSITTAQTGSAALHDAGLRHVLLRTPKSMARQGCGYSLRVTAARAALAAQCLRQAGASYQRIYQQAAPGDAPVEVVL